MPLPTNTPVSYEIKNISSSEVSFLITFHGTHREYKTDLRGACENPDQL